jgi:two-component system, cell cycle sensor histidine kinase and response regulator CckA
MNFKKLINSEQRLNTIMDTLLDGVLIFDQEGNISYANQSILNKLGHKDESQIIGINITNMSQIERPDTFLIAIKKAKNTGIIRNLELSIKNTKGNLFHFLVNATLIDNEQEAQEWLCVLMDITKQLHCDNELAIRDEEFKLIFDHAKDAVFWASTEDGLITNCNKAAENLMEMDKGHIIGKSQWNLHPEDQVDFYREKFRSHIERNGAVNDEAVIKTSTGKLINVDISASVTNIGGKTIIQGIFRDVSERKKRDMELLFLSSVIDNISEAVTVTDPYFNIVFINKAAEKLFGYALEEIKGQTPDIFNAEPLAAEIQSKLYQDIAKGETVLLTLLNKRKDNKKFYCEFKVAPMYDSTKTLVGYTGVQRDITDKIHSEKEKSEMQKQVFQASKLAAIGELAAGVAHEINNPLSIISGSTEKIRWETDKTHPHLKQTHEMILKAVYRISNIVKGLNELTRTDDSITKKVDIHSTISDTIALIETIYKKDGIAIEFKMDAKDFHILGNQGKLQQVLINLLSNAKDALSVKGGTIFIETLNQADKLEVKFTDNGVGIDPEYLERVFDSFFTTKPVGKGTGLGLSISHSIINSMFGEISVESSLGKGTTFTISLPIAQKATENSSNEVELEPRLHGRILVVDDEDDFRELLCSHLEKLGLTTKGAADGNEALAMIKCDKYDYVIADLKMPGMDGKTLAEEIKNRGGNERVILMTGGINIEDPKWLDKELKAASDGLLIKPFSYVELYHTLKDTN